MSHSVIVEKSPEEINLWAYDMSFSGSCSSSVIRA
jgi:hypothetical protein